MFTLAQTSMSGMCSVAKTLYPSIPLRGASYEDIAVSLVKALATGTDQVSTWSRPGVFVAGFKGVVAVSSVGVVLEHTHARVSLECVGQKQVWQLSV